MNGGRSPFGVILDQVVVKLGRKAMNLPRQVGVLVEELFRREKVVVRFGLLERGLTVLTNHDERREKDCLERDDERQRGPRTRLDDDHPHGKNGNVHVDELH